MNSFSHSLPFLDRPYFSIGCTVPDILAACDRRCRVREKKAINFIEDSDDLLRSVAQGVVQHHRDDDWFHRSAIFNNFNMRFAIEFRDRYENGHSMRPSLIGHIIIEMFLDWYLEEKHPGSVDRYYEMMESVDALKVQAAINRFATKPTEKLAPSIAKFNEVRFVYDYQTDAGIRKRMNNVLKRVKLLPMPESSEEWLGSVRQKVYDHAEELLVGYRWLSTNLK